MVGSDFICKSLGTAVSKIQVNFESIKAKVVLDELLRLIFMKITFFFFFFFGERFKRKHSTFLTSHAGRYS